MMRAEHVAVNYGDFCALKDMSFHVKKGQWLMIIGPNGAGKSTVVNAISQGIAYSGQISYCGRDLAAMNPGDIAREIAILAQNRYINYDFKVEDIVALGRYAHGKGLFPRLTKEDRALIDRALEMTGISDLRHKTILTLSGGEIQRCFLSRVFAQDPKLLILDEPTNHLDLLHQKQLFELIKDWLTEDKAVISVVHDLLLARAYGTHGLLLGKGKTVANGKIEEILSPNCVNPVYGMDIHRWMQNLLRHWTSDTSLGN